MFRAAVMKNSKPSFTSYLPADESSFPSGAEVSRLCEAALLPGELVVSETSNVRKCIATDTSAHDLYGTLLCTNFKISFMTKDVTCFQKFQHRNLLLEEHDISLTCVEQVVAVNDAKKKRKILGPNQPLKFKPTELIIYCKDFRIIRFRFDESDPESARKICLVIAHYSQPKDLRLLFGFAYAREQCQNSVGRANGTGTDWQTPLFETYADWDREIKRTGASEWRVSSVNENYATSTSLPEYFVVPSSLADEDLKQLAPSFNGARIPMWCWHHWTGSALVRMANIKPGIQLRKHDRRILKAIAQSHPEKSEVFKSDLDKMLPRVSEVQAALVRLKQLCIHDSFEETDEKWLSSLENTRWLEYVRLFLKHSAELTQWMYSKNISVILQEEEGRDLSCVVASVMQLMLDPHFRTTRGFQSLIQKEWVAAGYRFLDRCNHLHQSEKNECPLFLLFLDCVWQLLQQFPAAFEFTETYLTVLYDSSRISLFGTFLFNSQYQRAQQSQDFAMNGNLECEGKGLELPSVWNWSLQFTPRDRTLFNNPLFIGKSVSCVQNGTIKSFKRAKVALPSDRECKVPEVAAGWCCVRMANSSVEPGSRVCSIPPLHPEESKHLQPDDWQKDSMEACPVTLDVNLGDGDSSSEYVNNTSEEEDYDEGALEEEGVTYYIRYCPEEDSYLEDIGCTGGGCGTRSIAAERDDSPQAVEEIWAESDGLCQAMTKESEEHTCVQGPEASDPVATQAEVRNEEIRSSEGTPWGYSPSQSNSQSPQTSQHHCSKLETDAEDVEEDIDQIVAEIKMSMSTSSLNSAGEQSPGEKTLNSKSDTDLHNPHAKEEGWPRLCPTPTTEGNNAEAPIHEKPGERGADQWKQRSSGQVTSESDEPRKQQRSDLNGPVNNNYVCERRKTPSSFPNFVDVPGPCEPEDLIDGIIFAANYLGSTQLLSERNPSKNIRMMQAQEAVARIKKVQKTSKPKRKVGADGNSQQMTEVDLFISTQRIKVLNADSQDPIMDHALRTISYIADIGNIVVLMARRRVPRAASQDCIETTPGTQEGKKQYKMVCHVFESEDAQLIAQSIGQAFSVAYQEFLRANGINPEDLSQKEYSDVINTQEMYNDDLIHYSNSANCKELHIEKLKGEIFGVVIVESGWGSILPTVILANMMNGAPAARSGKLSIGDQIMSINGTSLVGLPLATCQGIIKGLKNQVEVKLNIVSCPPVTTVLIKRPDLKYQLGFSVQNGIICSLMRGGIAERGGVRVGHRIIEINGQSVVATAHEKIVQALSNSVGEIHMKTMPAAMFRLLTGQETPLYI
ncbi:myotubularin-related protein 10 isoform X2 [Narcine bancroftii]|uniref:myotubularin-related protein 10 isoform X2 n=1 Tax=Narcine bancroftii TaxID=1343680 RepID=UPI003831DA10